jgi:hypothetical protein
MKKLIVLAVTVGALAIAPSSALAASSWNGWGGTGASPASHTDNVSSVAYWQTFGANGQGDSQYCADTNPNAGTHCTSPDATSSPTSCVTATCAVYSPVYFAGYINNPDGSCAQGCGHGGTRCQSTGPGGGIYIGTNTSGPGIIGECQ